MSKSISEMLSETEIPETLQLWFRFMGYMEQYHDEEYKRKDEALEYLKDTADDMVTVKIIFDEYYEHDGFYYDIEEDAIMEKDENED